MSRVEKMRGTLAGTVTALIAAGWSDGQVRAEIEAAIVEARQGDVLDLVGPNEACEILGLNMEAFTKRRIRGTLPDPVAELACGTIWLRRDIEAVAA